MSDGQFATRELGPRDKRAVVDLLERVSNHESRLARSFVERFDEFDGWWMGAIRNGEVEALMAIDGHAGILVSQDDDATRAMAHGMVRQQQMLVSRGSSRHQLSGTWRTLDLFWQIFQAVDRQVVCDKSRELMAATEETESPSRRVTVDLATTDDLRVVLEFTGQHSAEMYGLDPRRVSPESHRHECNAVIAAGRQLIARESGGRPVMVAEVVDIGPHEVLLERLHVPLPFRGRKRLVGGAMAAARGLEPCAEKRLLLFADDPQLVAAAERANFERMARYRLISMVG